ncbi:MAG: tetratricopeptide repeat protein [Methylococcaceae bacterium]|nr:tetratricopeptide repeat protein [Methylococcaceae bacterium]
MSILRLFPVFCLSLLFGCATAPEQVPETKAVGTTGLLEKGAAKSKEKEDKDSLSPDVLFMLLTAELAGQRGQYDVAMEGYLEAAKRVHDPRLTERAAMIAMYMKDGNRTNEAVSLWLKQDPSNITARKISALSALKVRDKQAAVDQLSALLQSDPAGFEKSIFELAGALQKEGDVAFVYDVLDALAVKHPTQASVYFVQALLASDMKNKSLAESKIEQALRLQPDWDKALILRAQMALYADDYSRAEVLLRDASLKYPENEKFKKLLAQVLIKSAKYEEAVEVYDALIAANPKDTESRFSLGLVQLQLDRDSKAEDIFKDLQEESEWRNQSSFYLGKIEEKRNNTENALSWFDKVTEGPFEFEASVTAISLLAKEKQFDRASERLKLLPDKFPKQKTRILLIEAELYSQQKQYDKAFDLLTNELNSNPDQEDLLYSRALMADRLNKLDVMEADLRKILAKSPDNAEALNALGYALADKTNRFKEAEGYLIHAMRLKPDEAVILDSYGWLKYKMGDLENALIYLQRAYNKQPENEIAAHLAEVLWIIGKKEDAKKLYEKEIDDAPDDVYLLNFRDKFLQKGIVR